MKTFRLDATVLEPPALRPEARASFESALKTRGGSDLRVRDDEEGRVVGSFRLEAETEREAMVNRSEITLSALAGFHDVRWVSSGVSYWVDE